ncbi:NAD(+) diphosphatase [Oceanirhabdus sp. W0125-5]|uniref:NAD(+) diphosphatase n=1 Tax=Oceanirhabdus sp. W0125-5 TaxID=2999116 RepID=UPI0022F2C7EC|nr:NUDIX domain-containing protein [Oceanirhabdus sp. W0125-5]WBW99114.1 NUDIX domain-containing protein [Oceanirhabdus sp. W0125-5]
MEIKFCQKCGKKLTHREIGDEGLVPFCEECNTPYFKFSKPCVLIAVINDNKEIALLRQEYVSSTNWVLVAGFIQQGETAEGCAIREVKEETGLKVIKYKYISSYYHSKRNLLMLGYIAYVKKNEFRISGEVDKINWFSISDAHTYLRNGSIGMEHFNNVKKVLKN